MRSFKIAVAVLVAFGAGYATALLTRSPRTVCRTVTRVDTITVTRPEVRYVREIVERPVRCLALASPDSTRSAPPDSAYVEIPLVQTVYEGEDYRAVISGCEARLDSLSLYRIHTSTTLAAPVKAKRWSIGVQGGVGITPRGVQPYIGVGVSFRII